MLPASPLNALATDEVSATTFLYPLCEGMGSILPASSHELGGCFNQKSKHHLMPEVLTMNLLETRKPLRKFSALLAAKKIAQPSLQNENFYNSRQNR